jgi:hypothetical protein
MSLGVQVMGRDSATIAGRIIEQEIITETAQELLPAPDDDLLGPIAESYVAIEPEPAVADGSLDEPAPVEAERVISDLPTAAETPQPNPYLAPWSPAQRQQWNDLQARLAALPDRNDRGDGS